MAGRVAWISIAPVKGLGLLAPGEVELGRDGVHEDRLFHLIDGAGRMVNGKRAGSLVRVRPELLDDELALHLPDGSAVTGPVALGAAVQSNFFGRQRAGRLVDGPFSAALSELAGTSLRLVRGDTPGVDRGRGGAVSLLSVAACGEHDPRRFRMLFGVDGIPAHAEDDWVGYRVRVGEAIVRPTGHTGRCLVTSQDPDTGVADMDMLELLRRTRPADTSEPLPFGVHGSVAQPGTVRLGDPVEPL